MSTRSGKRIHGSFHEIDNNEDNPSSKSEKKSRRKQSKENVDKSNIPLLKSKKRVNYVTYPTDDELVGDVTLSNEGRSTRSLRKNTLKEHNMADSETDRTSAKTSEKQRRHTRRTKKFSQNDSEDIVEPVSVEAAVNVEVKPLTKKGKNRVPFVEPVETEPVPKRKSKRKKKKSSSNIVDTILEPVGTVGLNKSVTSVDSFHSAAGSPVKCNGIVNCNKIDDQVNIYSNDHTADSSQFIMQEPEIEDKKSPVQNRNSAKKLKQKRSGLVSDMVAVTSPVNNVQEDMKISKPDTETLDSSDIFKNYLNRKSRQISLIVNNCTEPFIFNHSNTPSETAKQVKNSTFDKAEVNSTFDKGSPKLLKRSLAKSIEDFDSKTNNRLSKRKSSLKQNTSLALSTDDFNATYEKEVLKMDEKKRKSSIGNVKDSTFDKSVISSTKVLNHTFDRLSNGHNTFDRLSNGQNTFDRLSNGQNTTFEAKNANITLNGTSVRLNSTYDKDPKTIDTTHDQRADTSNTLEKIIPDISLKSECNSTFDKYKPKSFDSENNKDLTFDKSSKSSLLTSDDTDKDMLHVSLTSDESNDNILNTTPVLIESSLDNTRLDTTKIETPTKAPVTPLKRQGTFTKDSSDVQQFSSEKTPQKRFSLPSPGCTPFHSSNKKRPMLNVTRSIEKSTSMASLTEGALRTTKVMFSSPVNNPAVVVQQKRKVIKSNLKGSNKSFIFEDKEGGRAGARKRSYTLGDADVAQAKRSRLGGDMQRSVDRLSRPRTTSASAKLEPTTPSKKLTTPGKAKPSRTKLPNFAAMHQKQFDKMESLDECQERKAKRAKKLLTPTGVVDKTVRATTKDIPHADNKADTPTKQRATIETLQPGYTRFGFKLNLDVNPFSIPMKNTEVKAKENPPNKLTRQATLPSLAGTTSLRREAAKQIVLREKSFTDKRSVKRNENRTIIKGVRTNRRFELQMKMRNID